METALSPGQDRTKAIVLLTDLLIGAGSLCFAYKIARNEPVEIAAALPAALGAILYLVVLGRRSAMTHGAFVARTAGVVSLCVACVATEKMTMPESREILDNHFSEDVPSMPPLFKLSHLAIKASVLFAAVVLMLAIFQ